MTAPITLASATWLVEDVVRPPVREDRIATPLRLHSIPLGVGHPAAATRTPTPQGSLNGTLDQYSGHLVGLLTPARTVKTPRSGVPGRGRAVGRRGGRTSREPRPARKVEAGERHAAQGDADPGGTA